MVHQMLGMPKKHPKSCLKLPESQHLAHFCASACAEVPERTKKNEAEHEIGLSLLSANINKFNIRCSTFFFFFAFSSSLGDVFMAQTSPPPVVL